MPSGNKPLPEPMMYVAIWWHRATTRQWLKCVEYLWDGRPLSKRLTHTLKIVIIGIIPEYCPCSFLNIIIKKECALNIVIETFSQFFIWKIRKGVLQLSKTKKVNVLKFREPVVNLIGCSPSWWSWWKTSVYFIITTWLLVYHYFGGYRWWQRQRRFRILQERTFSVIVFENPFKR